MPGIRRPYLAPFVTIVLTTFSGASPSQAQTPSPEHRVDSVFADVSGPTTPGCALSVMRDGAPIYERGYGMANLEYGIPITPHSVFHVASVSKHFTAMAIELLVDEGLVSWDDDVREYVPEVPDFETPITLRHLVHHTSGIRDQWALLNMAGWRWEADVVTQKDVLDVTSRQRALNFDPGARYLYSNTGFTLLAVVVERVTGQTLRAFTTERMFEPLGMEATHFHDDHEMIVRNRAWAYAPDPRGAFGLKNSIPDFDVVGATSLFTTAHEMAAWDRNFTTARVGGPAALERLRERYVLTTGDTIAYAHGIVHGTYRGLRTEGHGGADAGYRSSFLRFPEQRLSIVVLCNFPQANPGGRAERVADVYLGHLMSADVGESSEVSGLSTVPMTSEQLSPYAGVYRGEAPNAIIRLELDGDSLRLAGGPHLRPVGPDVFEVGGDEVRFTIDEAGRRRVDGPPGTFVQHPVWNPDPSELRRFAGVFRSEELGTEYRLVVEDDGQLWFHHRKLDSRPLTPANAGVFDMDGEILDFTRDGSVGHDAFRLSGGRVWHVTFERVTPSGGSGRDSR